MVAGSRDAGHRPGGVDNDRAGSPHSLTAAIGLVPPPQPRPRPEAMTPAPPAPPPRRARSRPREHTHERGDPEAPGDPGHHPDGAGAHAAPGGLGNEGDEQGSVPGQHDLATSADAHARHQRGNGHARCRQNQDRAGGFGAYARARQRDGVTGALAIARGQADESDRTPSKFSVCVHLPTVRPGTRGRLPANAPLWTTPTRDATLCIEGSDGGPLWIIPTLE